MGVDVPRSTKMAFRCSCWCFIYVAENQSNIAPKQQLWAVWKEKFPHFIFWGKRCGIWNNWLFFKGWLSRRLTLTLPACANTLKSSRPQLLFNILHVILLHLNVSGCNGSVQITPMKSYFTGENFAFASDKLGLVSELHNLQRLIDAPV